MCRRFAIVLLGWMVGLASLALLVLLAPTVPAHAAPATAEQATALQGTLRDPDSKPVADVKITVRSGAKKIDTTTTGSDGTWRVRLPGAGSYDISLHTGSLPTGLVLVEKGRDKLTDVSVSKGQERTVIFPLTTPQQRDKPSAGATPGAGQPSDHDTSSGSGSAFGAKFAQLFVEGLKYGAIIAITAVGLSLIFGTTGLINFAHGELVTIGAAIAFFFNAAAGGPGIQLIGAALIAVVLGSVFGGVLELGLWQPLRKRGTARIQLFIISIGLSLFLRHLVLVLFGSRPQPYGDYSVQKAMSFGPVSITPRDLFVIVASLVILVLVAVMLQRTRMGTAMRAVADNRDLAESSGINVRRVTLTVWVLGGGLATIGGVFYGLTETVIWDMGFKLLLLMFAGVILGGLGTAYGAMVGSLVIGLVAELSTLWFSTELQDAWALGIMLLVLLIRPQGIFGRAQRIG